MIQNQASFSYSDLFVIFGEDKLINVPHNIHTNDVVIDSRQVKEGSIFIALIGENIDAHSKVNEAFLNGASLCIVHKYWYDKNKPEFEDKPFILCNDTIEALGQLANYHRNRFEYPIIAVCGSNGKTTTKEMIASVLGEKLKVLKTFENYNNLLGVPLMLLSMNETYDIAVLELGTNQPGEIYQLGKICQPDNALITNIGKEHLEFLQDIDGVEYEETAIFGEVRDGGFAFVNYDDERLKNYGHILDKFMTYGTSKDAEVSAEIELDDNLKPTLKIKYSDFITTIKLNTFGIGTAKNAIAAVAVGFEFGLSPEQITKGLENFNQDLLHSYGRMAIENYNSLTIINDCYNANPASMELALENLKLLNTSKTKIAILGDMRELGDTSIEEHHSIINCAANSADIVCLIGNDMNNAFEMYEYSNNVTVFENKEDIVSFVQHVLNDGLVILVKGSRGMKMEEVIELLRPESK
ncbi:MAG TPA: UDP-N-acetylmuramoyl-tripeptide--D-alanyl-D-alanine ligase [Candidatus Kapabacteria bacterium]|nr:UDP-N-acetylmuramoyl-tripeptide--D-alanyl-D-alanine ligase [Candidatus Kapabacteria bacterium]